MGSNTIGEYYTIRWLLRLKRILLIMVGLGGSMIFDLAGLGPHIGGDTHNASTIGDEYIYFGE